MNQLLAEADTIKPLDHKQHKIARPNILVNSNQPSHLVKWVKNDRNCVVCSGPEEQIICVTLVMFIYMQKSALVHFILPEVLILNRLHTSLLQKLRLFKNVKVWVKICDSIFFLCLQTSKSQVFFHAKKDFFKFLLILSTIISVCNSFNTQRKCYFLIAKFISFPIIYDILYIL